MKCFPCWLLILALSFSVRPGARADEIDGDNLNIGAVTEVDSGNTSDSTTDSGMIGDANYLSSSERSLLVGDGNTGSGIGDLFGVGTSLSIYNSHYSIVVGTYIWATNANDSLMLGSFQSATDGECDLEVGYNNAVSGFYQFALGIGLAAARDDSGTPKLVVGSYNDTTLTGQVLTVGIGTGPATGATTTTRKNALEVYANGDVRVPKAQGDISMGNFGN